MYLRLAKLRIINVCGLTVPKLRDHRHDVKLLRMDFVSPPYLLDFAGASLSPPDFSTETMADWHSGIEEKFGPNTSVAYDVYHFLSRHGIYYIDFRPSNMNLTGMRGLKPELLEGEDS